MQLNRFAYALVLILIMAACGAPPAPTASSGSDTVPPTSPPVSNNIGGEPTPTREGDTGTSPDTAVVGFEAQLTGGGFNNQIVGEGWYVCGETSDIVSNSGMQSIIFISFPADSEPGIYNFGSDEVTTQVQFDAENIYNVNQDGTLTLQAVANVSGDAVRGAFDFTVANVDGDVLTVSGTFDFVATSDAGCN